MRLLATLILALSISSLSLSAGASSEISVGGVSISYACLYFSNYSERLHVTYVDKDLPAGTTVKLHWGLGGYTPWQDPNGGLHQTPIVWQDPVGVAGENKTGSAPGQDLVLTQTGSNPPTYEITLEADVHDRSVNNYFNQFKFLFIQVQPGGTYYDKPGDYGFYETDFVLNGACYQDATTPAYQLAPLTVISKPNG